MTYNERFNEALAEEATRALEFILWRNVLQVDALSLRSADGTLLFVTTATL